MEKDNRKYRICFIDYMWYVAEIWHERERTNLNGRMLLFWCWLFVLLIPLGVPPILRLFGWMIGLAIVIPLCFLPDLFCNYRYRPDRGKCSADVPPRIYTLGMMKRQENKQRFYLWDYLWWVGERLHEYHLRITGESMLFMYFNFLLYVPVMSLLAFARVYHTFQQCMWGVYLVLALVYVIWGEKLYGVRRRKAVMSHYADRRFKPATGFLLFFLPVMFFVAMIITIVSLMK